MPVHFNYANVYMNYFEYHGSSIWDKRREILEKAIFCDENNIEVIRHEKRGDKFAKQKENNSWKFIYHDRLYYFCIDYFGQISDFFDLVMSKNEAYDKNCGCFYTFYQTE
jgi:hypothetical protein